MASSLADGVGSSIYVTGSLLAKLGREGAVLVRADFRDT